MTTDLSRRDVVVAGLALGVLGTGVARAADAAPAAGLPIGVSYSGWRGGFAAADKRLAAFRAVGFPIITFIPAYAYVGRNRVDLSTGPSADELGRAVELALRDGRSIVMKPHLEPPNHSPGYSRLTSDNHSWRAECGWRGFFDIDPMTPDYREGVIFGGLRMLKSVFERVGVAPGPARVRFDLGAELMNSAVEFPERWGALLAAARAERKRLGLEGQVLFSHNFSHHVQIPEDQLDRMSGKARKALGRYVAGLDAVALSQYMDLTVLVPPAERGKRLPTVDEVAGALRQHEKTFRRDILERGLGVTRIPPFHVGEFGVGAGGLRHPNLWGGTRTPEVEKQLLAEIARGHEGLVRYLSQAEGRTAGSAVLWVTGPHFDIFGWGSPAYAVPGAMAAIRAGLGAAP